MQANEALTISELYVKIKLTQLRKNEDIAYWVIRGTTGVKPMRIIERLRLAGR